MVLIPFLRAEIANIVTKAANLIQIPDMRQLISIFLLFSLILLALTTIHRYSREALEKMAENAEPIIRIKRAQP